MKITSTILTRIPLSKINRVTFYKRDEITTDLICCDVETDGQTWTSHEEMKGWDDFIIHLQGFPDFRSDWYEKVVQPSFATSETVAYYRR